MNELEKLEKQREALDRYIKTLDTWDCHAENMQAKYDYLINQINKLKEQQYPIYARNKHTDSVVEFIGLNKGTLIEKGGSFYNEGHYSDEWTKHTDTDFWEILPYDEERGLYHTQLVYCWDDDETHRVVLRFYDARNKKPFTYKGCANGKFYDNYSATMPEFMKTAYKTLEK